MFFILVLLCLFYSLNMWIDTLYMFCLLVKIISFYEDFIWLILFFIMNISITFTLHQNYFFEKTNTKQTSIYFLNTFQIILKLCSTL